MNEDLWRSFSRGRSSGWCFDGTGHTCLHSAGYRGKRGGTAARPIGRDWRQAGHSLVTPDWRESNGPRRMFALTALNAVRDGWGATQWWRPSLGLLPARSPRHMVAARGPRGEVARGSERCDVAPRGPLAAFASSEARGEGQAVGPRS